MTMENDDDDEKPKKLLNPLCSWSVSSLLSRAKTRKIYSKYKFFEGKMGYNPDNCDENI